MNTRIINVVMVAVVALAFGCGGAQRSGTGSNFQTRTDKAPEWTFKRCKAFSGDKKDYICGAGVATGIQNFALCRKTSEARAQMEIVEALAPEIASLIEDYMKSVAGGASFGKASSEEQFVRNTAERYAKLSLSGMYIEDNWYSPQGDCYSLAVYEPAKLREFLKDADLGADVLDKETHDHIVQNAETALENLRKRTAEEKPPKSN